MEYDNDKWTLISRLSPHLFWDIDLDDLDIDIHAPQIVQRVLEYGEIDDWRYIRDYYGLPRIAAICMQLRTLRPEALSFVCCMTGTKKTDYRCYLYTQLRPTLWNS